MESPSGQCVALCLLGYGSVITLGLYKSRNRSRVISIPLTCSKDFECAAEYFSRNTSRFTSDLQLELYALYKQATIGDASEDLTCGISLLDPKRRIMNEAWISKRGLEHETAEREYLRIVDSRCPFWREGACSEPSSAEERPGWAVGSVPVDVIGNTDRDESIIGQVCELAAEGNLNAVRDVVDKAPNILQQSDVDGMTCLHWASDRGHDDLVAFLLDKNSNPNASDLFGNTPLHSAAMAGQTPVLRRLLDAKADIGAINQDGDSAASIIKSEFPRLLL